MPTTGRCGESGSEASWEMRELAAGKNAHKVLRYKRPVQQSCAAHLAASPTASCLKDTHLVHGERPLQSKTFLERCTFVFYVDHKSSTEKSSVNLGHWLWTSPFGCVALWNSHLKPIDLTPLGLIPLGKTSLTPLDPQGLQPCVCFSERFAPGACSLAWQGVT